MQHEQHGEKTTISAFGILPVTEIVLLGVGDAEHVLVISNQVDEDYCSDGQWAELDEVEDEVVGLSRRRGPRQTADSEKRKQGFVLCSIVWLSSYERFRTSNVDEE
jgi:hypothetical protein